MNDYAPDDGSEPDVAAIAGLIKRRRELPPDVFRQAAQAASVADSATVAVLMEQTAIADASELEPILDRILAANQAQVAAYRSGKEGLLGFFVGQVMKETRGKADPRRVNELLREKLRV
jgi:glutaminyl-tRNA synthetase